METRSSISYFTREPEAFCGSVAFVLSEADADGDLVLESPRLEERSFDRLRRRSLRRDESRGDFDRLRRREGDLDLCRRRSLSDVGERDRFFRSWASTGFLSSLSRLPLCFDEGRCTSVGFPLARPLNDHLLYILISLGVPLFFHHCGRRSRRRTLCLTSRDACRNIRLLLLCSLNGTLLLLRLCCLLRRGSGLQHSLQRYLLLLLEDAWRS